MVMAVHSSSIIAERALKQREELMSHVKDKVNDVRKGRKERAKRNVSTGIQSNNEWSTWERDEPARLLGTLP